MKNTLTSPIFWFSILLIGCTTKKTYILNGVIGKGMQSILTLDVNGNKVSGKFYYPQNKKSINISGELKNGALNLSEFDSNNDISGYFVGSFDHNKYEGRWTDPKGKSSATFKYSILNPNINLKDEINSKPKSDDKIVLAYQNWVYQMVKSGEYCYEKEWNENKERHEKEGNPYYGGDGKDALPDDIGYLKYGDINGDKKIDAWADVYPIYDMAGTWSITMSGIHLFFISNSQGSYDVIDEPEIIESGAKGGVDTILPNGIIIYEGRDYSGDDARCCPSDTWKTRYRYQNKQFVRIK
jgi:hypothetical protein